MFTCKTENCLANGEEHAPHPENVVLICGVCMQEMTDV